MLSISEDEECRQRGNAVFSGEVGLAVAVDLDEGDDVGARKRFSEALVDRSDLLARTAPLGPD